MNKSERAYYDAFIAEYQDQTLTGFLRVCYEIEEGLIRPDRLPDDDGDFDIIWGLISSSVTSIAYRDAQCAGVKASGWTDTEIAAVARDNWAQALALVWERENLGQYVINEDLAYYLWGEAQITLPQIQQELYREALIPKDRELIAADVNNPPN